MVVNLLSAQMVEALPAENNTATAMYETKGRAVAGPSDYRFSFLSHVYSMRMVDFFIFFYFSF